jgi:hypothetical protein
VVLNNNLSQLVLPILWPSMISNDIYPYDFHSCLMYRMWIIFRMYYLFLTMQQRPNTLSVLNSPAHWVRLVYPSNCCPTNRCIWKYMNLLHYSKLKLSYVLQPPFEAIFRKVLFKGYITRTSKPLSGYGILRFKYMIHNIS